MIETNRRLKDQVLELAKQMTEVVGKNQKKKKYGIHLEEELGDREETLKQENKIN